MQTFQRGAPAVATKIRREGHLAPVLGSRARILLTHGCLKDSLQEPLASILDGKYGKYSRIKSHWHVFADAQL